MTKTDNQSTPQIYYRPLHQWIEVTLEEKKNWERFVNATRKAKQRAGACCIPYKKSYLCGATWEEITMNLYHNRRWIFRLHDKALTVVQEILDHHETSH